MNYAGFLRDVLANCNLLPSRLRAFSTNTLKTFLRFASQASLLPCLSLLHYIVQFSRFDLPTAFAARFEDLSYARSSNPTTTVVSVSRPPDEIRSYLALHARCNLLVGPSGLEPPTLRLSVVRSSQLSYGPVVDTSSISLAALHAVRLAHFAASPLPRRPASLGSARMLDDWLLYCFSCFPQKRMLLWDGGDSRDRTGDLLLARQALSQLSYIPKLSSLPADFIACAL